MLDVIPFPQKRSRPPVQPKATAQDLFLDCCRELGGEQLEHERAGPVYRALSRLDVSVHALLSELLKSLRKAAESEIASDR